VVVLVAAQLETVPEFNDLTFSKAKFKTSNLPELAVLPGEFTIQDVK
jgi:hypothetical protein